VLDTSYDGRSGPGPLRQVTRTFLVHFLLTFTSVGTGAGLRRVNVLPAYVVPVISPLRGTVKVPAGVSPASKVPEIV
jgi:hypothetical protein